MQKKIYVPLLLLLAGLLAAAGVLFLAVRHLTRADGSGQAPSRQEADRATLQPAVLKIVFPLERPANEAEVIRAVEAKLAQDGLPLKLEITYIPYAQYWSKIWLLAASGEPYDLVVTAYSNIPDLAAKKVLAPLDEALEGYGSSLVKNTPAYAFKGVTVNGRIYGIPRVMPMAEFQSFLQIRGDLRKKYGLPEIRTIAGMDAYLEAVSKHEKDIVPYYYDTGKFLLREYGNAAFLAGGFFNSPVYIDPADPELRVRNTYESDRFRDIMAKMHEWQAKGYAPYPPSVTSQFPDPEQAFLSGRVAATWSVVMKQTERVDAFKAAHPEGELENVYLHPEKPKYLFTAADNILSVLSTSAHVKESVAFVNWLRSSQENFDLFTYGIEGVHYKLKDGALSYEGIPPERRYTPVHWAWDDIRYARFSEHIPKEYAAALRSWDQDAVLSPTLGFVPDLAPVKSEMAQLQVITGEYLPQLYDAGVDWESVMGAFRAKLKDAGIDHVVEEIQEQFDRFREEGGGASGIPGDS
ncbi:ABC transporter substrate-binding protein [Paenibacillus caseinilyticus]|uniref:ABC transporter substrate-binding protein n=1 Tax=Paenibacillus mucilaginosus K02 TaxID=997761 RepID=I0BD23_9BACL|nr:ABC transporter substrate-binding protein [Paenibacillus mucilaginosus]AFH60270.2 ABC transporter substrate-binding protein [Paenibacillus mucilaginosus K02]